MMNDRNKRRVDHPLGPRKNPVVSGGSTRRGLPNSSNRSSPPASSSPPPLPTRPQEQASHSTLPIFVVVFMALMILLLFLFWNSRQSEPAAVAGSKTIAPLTGRPEFFADGKKSAGGSGPGNGGKVRFFGIESEGKHIAYVIDKSGSMIGCQPAFAFAQINRCFGIHLRNVSDKVFVQIS